MPTEVKKIIHITSDVYQIDYDQSKRQFQLALSLPVEAGDTREVRVFLDENIVRQMAEVLPPLDPEIVH